ncbi:MAG: 50S ribosomal protein L19 [Spirochaetes bacterium]|nr:50S ribosomal protein L19 [Spirochaetota bacterium]
MVSKSKEEELTPEIKNEKINQLINRERDFKVGDLIKIYYKIVENKRERIQVFEGNIISFKGKGLTRSLKVRKLSYGVGVERTFPLLSPNIAKIELVRRGKVRRAKLYYLRDRSGRSAIIKEKINFKKTKIKN